MVREGMTLQELLLRMLVPLQPVIPILLAVLGISMAVCMLLAVESSGLWVNSRHFRWLGVLFGLNRWECVRLGCSWLKLLFTLVSLLFFSRPSAVIYIFVLVSGLLYTLDGKAPHRFMGRLLWLALEMAGLVATNLICGFYRDMNGGMWFLLIYVVMALFMMLFGLYLFLTEIGDISEGRSAVRYEEELEEREEAQA